MTTHAAEPITFDELLSTVFADDFRELTEHAGTISAPGYRQPAPS